MNTDTPDRKIILNGADFCALRQLTLEIPSFRGDAMNQLGWTDEIDTFLRKLVRSAPRNIDPESRVKVVLTDDLYIDAPPDRPGPTSALAANEELVRYAPRAAAAVWPQLLAVTWDRLGALEAFYRTGYREPEIVAALASLTAAVSSALGTPE
ncbi:hypothetical protein [Nocardia sp. NPDC005366]|uniref:hypothetical protein n=1 Tax=Nocardia sp. NPDC005366 TaxID=3156878 RepID=UPI0033B7FE9B